MVLLLMLVLWDMITPIFFLVVFLGSLVNHERQIHVIKVRKHPCSWSWQRERASSSGYQ
jgi:hypothetical protein